MIDTIALECNHCGLTAVFARPDGTYDEDTAGRCVSCGYPGRVQIVDDEEDTPADAYWLCDDDENARCAIPSCRECYGGDVATFPISAARGLYDRALSDVVAASRVEAELRAEVERLKAEATRDADRRATLVAAMRRIANGHDYPRQVAAAALAEVGA